MTDPDVSPDARGRYPIDFDNAAEMARLSKQSRLQIDSAGLFPVPLEFPRGSRFLDIGCGPGVWALDVARLSPKSEIVGIDISSRMLDYARSCAESMQLTNVSFQVLDARQPLPFHNHSFDYINLSFATSYLIPSIWPVLLQECYRLLRPGGIFCSTEADGLGIVTTAALSRYFTLLVEAMRQLGLVFTKEGQMFGIMAVQRKLLLKAGLVEVQGRPLLMDYSAGTAANASFYDDFRTALKLTQPLIVKQGLISQKEINRLYDRALQEMRQEDFCGIALGQMAWGKKPEPDAEIDN
jgi:ubiquinone/menaquinone biosynthesis C-methylase UbiE